MTKFSSALNWRPGSLKWRPKHSKWLAEHVKWLSEHERAAITTGLVAALIVGAALLPLSDGFPLRLLAAVAVVVSVGCLWLVARASTEGVWSIPFVCLLALIIFHLGALPEFLYTDHASLVYIERFIHTPQSAMAAWLSMMTVVAFTLGCHLVAMRSGPTRVGRPPRASSLRSSVSDVGSIMAILSVIAWMAFALKERLILASYAEYLEAKSAYPLQLLYYVLGLGLVLAMVDYRRWLARSALAAFGIFTIVGFPLGLRGEVLFPLAAGATLVAMQRRMPRPRTLLIAVVVLLIPITVVSQTRQSDHANLGSVSFSPLNGLSELGLTLEVVSTTVDWHHFRGEGYDWGRTYLVPVEDSFKRYVLLRSPRPESTNSAYMSTQISKRAGNIGGSIVGEAHHNFGIPGALAILFLWGGLLSGLNAAARRRGGLWIAGAGWLCFVFLLIVRNSFASVPTVVLVGIAALAAAWVLEQVRRRVRPGDRSGDEITQP